MIQFTIICDYFRLHLPGTERLLAEVKQLKTGPPPDERVEDEEVADPAVVLQHETPPPGLRTAARLAVKANKQEADGLDQAAVARLPGRTPLADHPSVTPQQGSINRRIQLLNSTHNYGSGCTLYI